MHTHITFPPKPSRSKNDPLEPHVVASLVKKKGAVVSNDDRINALRAFAKHPVRNVAEQRAYRIIMNGGAELDDKTRREIRKDAAATGNHGIVDLIDKHL
ncbi:hypothetical protein EPO34_00215 [Patescibacteria group bacterium]|nr:MAG: hypothetical protein EPO34_00215 [Patescibacteria group bacterium]